MRKINKKFIQFFLFEYIYNHIALNMIYKPPPAKKQKKTQQKTKNKRKQKR